MCNESSHKVIRFPEGFSRSKLLTPVSLLVRGRSSPIALLTVRTTAGAILHSRLDLGKGMLIDGIPGKYHMRTCKRLIPKIVAHYHAHSTTTADKELKRRMRELQKDIREENLYS